jgi:hypothetical protein
MADRAAPGLEEFNCVPYQFLLQVYLAERPEQKFVLIQARDS